MSATDELVFTGASDGWLRIYDAATGEVLWTYDTTQRVGTLGGGSIGGGAGPIAWRGSVYVESGYGFAGRMPGNVLLVFGVD